MTPTRPAQHGAALLLALLLVALVTTLAAGMVWQQWRSIESESALRTKAQAQWILNGATDWVRLILREDRRAGVIDHLGEPWATPLAEARLSSFLAAERELSPDDGTQAFLSGGIEDAQSRFNLRNLVDESGRVNALAWRTLQALTLSAGVPALAEPLRRGLSQAWGPTSDPTVDRPLAPQQLEDLRWWGLDAAAIEALRPWVDLLPERTPVNVNTAPAGVLAAVLGVDLLRAQRLVQQRKSQAFQSLDAVRVALDLKEAPAAELLSVQSRYFWALGRLRLDERTVAQRSLLVRRGGGLEVQWVRRDTAPSPDFVLAAQAPSP